MVATITIPIEEAKQRTLSRVDKTIIYLGIPTNILCVDDRLEPNLMTSALSEKIDDFTATLYLGKIIFEKNKDGNFAPKYIPSHISESSFEGLNLFWLNELNPNAKKPFKSLIECEPHWELGRICEVKNKNTPYQKIHYYRSKDNIVLSKEQIISYFSELHALNTTFIKDYIDSINQAQSIKAYHLYDKLYDELLEKGILKRSMFEWYRNGVRSFASSQAKLLALDYLKKTGANSAIAYYDELFYVYFIVSLKNFILQEGYDENTKEYVDTNKLIFNTGVYKKYYDMSLFDTIKHGHFYRDVEQRYAISLFMQNTTDAREYIDGFNYQTPNGVPRTNQLPIYTPSPLGHYYFELTDNLNTFVEYYPRIYPSITTPPKGWSKEMMKKLELELE